MHIYGGNGIDTHDTSILIGKSADLIGKTDTEAGSFEGSFIKFLKDTDTDTNTSTNRLALGHAGDRFDATDYSVSSNIKYNKTLNIIKGGNVGIGVIEPTYVDILDQRQEVYYQLIW